MQKGNKEGDWVAPITTHHMTGEQTIEMACYVFFYQKGDSYTKQMNNKIV
jgi:hypothetical protein